MKYSGFTLMELVVVMAVIAILAAMIGPTFFSYQKKSQLLLSSQLLESGFSEGFSSARSRPKSFYIWGKLGDSGFDIFECDTLSIESIDTQECVLLRKQSFEGSVKLSQDVSILFIPPFGDILGLTESPSLFQVENDEGESRSILLYEKSGLSSPLPNSNPQEE